MLWTCGRCRCSDILSLGTTGAVMTLVIAALPFFFLAMYEKDGQPAEKILRNYIGQDF